MYSIQCQHKATDTLTLCVLITNSLWSHVTESNCSLATAVDEQVTGRRMKFCCRYHLRQLLHVCWLYIYYVCSHRGWSKNNRWFTNDTKFITKLQGNSDSTSDVTVSKLAIKTHKWKKLFANNYHKPKYSTAEKQQIEPKLFCGKLNKHNLQISVQYQVVTMNWHHIITAVNFAISHQRKCFCHHLFWQFKSYELTKSLQR